MASGPEITSTPDRVRHELGHGRYADKPKEVLARGWKDVLVRMKIETRVDNIPLLSAGVAFYALLALVPGLVATVSIYGLAADPSAIGRHINDLLGAAPAEVRTMVESQMRSITASSHAKLGIGAVFGVLVAFWSASNGMRHAIAALNAAYDEVETNLCSPPCRCAPPHGWCRRLRSRRRGRSRGSARTARRTVLGPVGRVTIDLLRWPALGMGLIAGLAVLYRYGPDRAEPKWRWVTPGALLATTGWLIGSALFSIYAANFGRYNQTYGSLGAVIVVMLWLFLTVAVVLVGAELNAELERQTLRDSTRGPDRRSASAVQTSRTPSAPPRTSCSVVTVRERPRIPRAERKYGP